MSRLDIDLVVERRQFDVVAKLELAAGERLALFGPSGAGKTTLLEAVAGLANPSAGGCHLDETLVSRPPGRRRPSNSPALGALGRISLVRQPTALFPHLPVAANVGYGTSLPELVEEVLADLDLAELRRSYPGQLSGGQAQRVALARALARSFDLLLLDEPMAAMDGASRERCWRAVEKRCADEGAMAILVTHDLAEAQAFGDRLAVMDQGRLLQMGDPHEVVANPGSRRAAEVLGYQNFLRLRPARGSSGFERGEVMELAIEAGRVEMGSHPDEGLVLRGKVSACVPFRTGYQVTLSFGEEAVVEAPFEGPWALEGEAKLVMQVDRRVTMGKEILATAVAPPVVIVRPNDREDFL